MLTGQREVFLLLEIRTEMIVRSIFSRVKMFLFSIYEI